MSIETKVYSALSGSSALTALVSSAIYPEHRMQADALPAVVYNRASGFRVNSLSGYDGLEQASIDVFVYARTVDSRANIGNAVINAMSSASGCSVSLNDSPVDFFDDEVEVYERQFTFMVWNRE